jgi:hypothetical protein
MATITGAGRETQLYMHTLAAAVSVSAQRPATVLDLSGIHEPSPAAQDAAVTAHLDAALAGLETVIRSKKTPPSGLSPATQGRKLIERGEVYDAVARTYTPGPGFATLINALFAEAMAADGGSAISPGDPDYQIAAGSVTLAGRGHEHFPGIPVCVVCRVGH